MGIVNEPVEDGIGNGGIADLFMPVFHRELTGDDGGGMTIPLFDKLQEVSPFGIGHGRETEIVNHQDMSLGKFADGLAVTSVSLGQGHLIGELGSADVEGARYPTQQALLVSAQARKVIPAPVGPVIMMLWWRWTQSQEMRFIMTD